MKRAEDLLLQARVLIDDLNEEMRLGHSRQATAEAELKDLRAQNAMLRSLLKPASKEENSE